MKKKTSDFNRNVFTLFSGTFISQLIPIILGPILTRLYSPEDFGTFALYMSIVSILSVIITGRYDLAIVLPREDSKAKNLLFLSLIISATLSFLFLVLFILFKAEIVNLLGNEQVGAWLFIIPFALILCGFNQSLSYFFNRKVHFKDVAASRVIQSLFSNTIQVSFAFVIKSVAGFIVGSLVGQIVSVYYLIKRYLKEFKISKKEFSKESIIKVSREYSSFPKFDILASLSNTSSHQIVHIMFNSFFGASTAGQFYLIQRVLGLPITFIAAAFLDVFKVKAAKDFEDKGEAKEIFRSTFYKLFVLGSIPAVILFLYSEDLIGFVFGENWSIAGRYAKLLIPMFFLRFVANPLSFMIYIGGKQKVNLVVNAFLFLGVLSSFYFGKNNAEKVIILISLSFSIMYFLHLLISAKVAGFFQEIKFKSFWN